MLFRYSCHKLVLEDHQHQLLAVIGVELAQQILLPQAEGWLLGADPVSGAAGLAPLHSPSQPAARAARTVQRNGR